ncbi:MAG: Rieske 2Fe-2S domain-containing protein [Alphaproteobacteria bacterium]|nr:Rieske 2Fe-2S domain-containing protein [Alphaproteobacteria bacterium]
MADETWHQVANTTEINPDDPKKVTIDGEEIALFNVDGEIFATHNICTHAFASLADGFQEGAEVECPLHEGRFDVKSGKALCAPVSEDLKTYEVKIEDGAVFVKA